MPERLRNNHNHQETSEAANPTEEHQEQTINLASLTPEQLFERLATQHSLILPQDQRSDYVREIMDDFRRGNPENKHRLLRELSQAISPQLSTLGTTPEDKPVEKVVPPPIPAVKVDATIFNEEKPANNKEDVIIYKKPNLAKRALYKVARPVYLAYSGIRTAFNKTRKFLHLQPLVQHGHH